MATEVPVTVIARPPVPTGRVTIKSPTFNEYLYCAKLKLNGQRRHVFTWSSPGQRPPTDPQGGEYWNIERVTRNGEDVYTIRSEWARELLYVGGCKLNDQRRNLLTWFGGEAPPTTPAGGEFWKIEHCAFDTSKWTIRSAIHEELLYVGGTMFDDQRRHGLTWVGGCDPPTTPPFGHLWTIENA